MERVPERAVRRPSPSAFASAAFLLPFCRLLCITSIAHNQFGSYSVRNFDEPQGGFLPPGEAGTARARTSRAALSHFSAVEALGVSQQVDEEERLLLAAAAPTTTEEMHPKALMTTDSIPVILGVRRIYIHNEEDAIDRALEARHCDFFALFY
jgi:hypothetical protein